MDNLEQSIENCKTEPWDIDKLIAYARNPRENDHAVDAMAAQIKEFGWRVPIVAKSDGSVIDGHLRLKAARKLKLKRVPVMPADDLSDVQIKALRVAINRAAELAKWDMDLLKLEVQELDNLQFDIDLLGFDDIETFLDISLENGGVVEGNIDDDAVPEVEQNVHKVELGQVYKLGNHRLMCGDSTCKDTVGKLMDGEKADMVFTDPPYGINESAAKRSTRETNNLAKSNSNLKEFKDDSIDYAIDAFNICNGLDINVQIWWGANYYCHSLPQTNNWAIWDKRIEEKQRDNNSDCEMAWVKNKNNSCRIFRHLWKGLITGSEHGIKRVHPTQKPIQLAIDCFEYYKSGKSVLDLFLGSGSTLIACEKTNRTCYGMELDPHYCSVIIERWQQFTGKKAELLND